MRGDERTCVKDIRREGVREVGLDLVAEDRAGNRDADDAAH